MTVDDLVEALRVKGIDGIERVRMSYIESDGEISALLFEPPRTERIVQETAAEQAQKQT